ncbi:hypothetical protein BV20DRAFT_480504 [Pilatotrama ljubarskyi]|nr:hypothetical protein BV20DRAFT_480504 [Pilatotrama ljubarskyi]
MTLTPRFSETITVRCSQCKVALPYTYHTESESPTSTVGPSWIRVHASPALHFAFVRYHTHIINQCLSYTLLLVVHGRHSKPNFNARLQKVQALASNPQFRQARGAFHTSRAETSEVTERRGELHTLASDPPTSHSSSSSSTSTHSPDSPSSESPTSSTGANLIVAPHSVVPPAPDIVLAPALGLVPELPAAASWRWMRNSETRIALRLAMNQRYQALSCGERACRRGGSGERRGGAYGSSSGASTPA